MAVHDGMADGVYAAVEPVQPPGPDASCDRVAAEPEFLQLPDAHDAVLSTGEIREPDIAWGY